MSPPVVFTKFCGGAGAVAFEVDARVVVAADGCAATVVADSVDAVAVLLSAWISLILQFVILCCLRKMSCLTELIIFIKF